MKRKWEIAVKRRGLALTGLIGIAAVAALLTVFGTAATADAQQAPSVTATYEGWAADDELTAQQSRDVARNFEFGWNCSDLRCHYVRVEWSGIAPLDNLEKVDGINDGPGWHLSVVPKRRGVLSPLNKTVGVEEAGGGNGPYVYYAAVPWAGERVSVSIKGSGLDQNDSDSVIIPAHTPASFNNREHKAGAALVDWALMDWGGDTPATNLPMVISLFQKVANATHYEVEYTFRQDLNQSEAKFSRTTRTIVTSQKRGLYERLNANWNHHKDKNTLNDLTNADFDGENAQWIFVTTPLPKLVSGREGWPLEEDISDDDITNAMDRGQGKGSVGIRVIPVIACSSNPGADWDSDFCSAGSSRLETLPLKGRSSKVSYVKFTSEDLE